MTNEKNFDLIIESKLDLPEIKINNLAEILFNKISARNEDSKIIISHIDDKIIELKLGELRYIVANLYEEFGQKNIKPGDTVLLSTLFVNNELLTAIMFAALTTYGSRVLFPMFVETSEIKKWFEKTKCKHILLPKKEVLSLDNKYEGEKRIIRLLIKTAEEKNIDYYDISEDFNIFSYIDQCKNNNDLKFNKEIVDKVISNTNLSTDSVIFTTSGTTGRSKLVVYEQGSFIRNCYCWQISGMYSYDNLGGRSFLDIFTHTVSARAFFNALWTGNPICILTSDLILKKPQKVLPILMKMKPETITTGPSAIEFILEAVILYPEIKRKAFSELRTIVSTGAAYNKKTAGILKKYFGLTMQNAYGTSETQQSLTTLLDKSFNPSELISLGSPLAGAKIGLKKFDTDLYKLFVKTPFGHKYCIPLESNNLIYPEEFFDTGDIVKLVNDDKLIFIGREKRDFFNNCYGAKVPISFMKEAYKELYKKSDHIEYYPGNFSKFKFCVAALIFIENDDLPKGNVINKRIINEYSKIITNTNKTLSKTIEPFVYEHRSIRKFLLINGKAPRTKKRTISNYFISNTFKDEINRLKSSYNSKDGVKIVASFKETFYITFLNSFVFNNKLLLKLLLDSLSFKYKSKTDKNN